MAHDERLLQSLLTEITTETGTAEIALWTIALCVAALVASVIAQWWFRRRGDARSAAMGFAWIRLAAVIMVFLMLSQQVMQSGWLTSADSSAEAWFVTHRSSGGTTAAVVVTTIGGPAGVGVATVVTAGLWWWRRRSVKPAALLVGAVLVAGAANSFVKVAVARARPPLSAHLVAENDWSYPSGHVVGTAAFVGVTLVLYLPAAQGRLRRVAAVAAAIAAVATVALSRLYLGVHWLTDVAGGVLLGAVVALTATLIAAAVRMRATSITSDADVARRREANAALSTTPSVTNAAR